MRRSLADVSSLGSSIRHDGMILTLVIIYVGICLIYLSANFGTEMGWMIRLLPEIMLLAVGVLALVSKITDPIVRALFPWPQLGRGKTRIMQVSWISEAMLIRGYRPLYLLLSLNPFNWYFWKINESRYLYNKRRAAKKQAK
ncbi:MAG: hypothetical protein A2406_02220 [Candidatus Komeilibacteria bacterium RIFOXYC1_FULL_37_11]|uniref:Uncharacterized protein n=1 Tax=Candidatus Komeilibacteria bacterium RIFOXYC1_FULL_37_11 TaxID=1798555 RepID=A0A1G2C212_9BACT|nr:MAG: hypothetical protein A2406_02220 [Candidatus Komeilibacteria bacterium RIFOXYC1_FULL_37_11]OGY95527.1 MAG: hypothetical protein A2611_02405 [Candidatus Komeilibacteria bacterium RIFOXYD1_FULL_37_29]